jgi:hypothetical protein
MEILLQMRSSICCDCCRKFKHPDLGDFAYGSFILSRNDGLAFRYLNAFKNPAWDFVAGRLQARDSTVLQEAVARIADASEGQSFTMSVVCPYCKSPNNRDDLGEPARTGKIPYATFEAFVAMDEHEKTEFIRKVEEQVRVDSMHR